LCVGRPVDGEIGERRDDLFKIQSDSLRYPNKGQSPQDVTTEQALVTGGPFGVNQTFSLVEANGRRRETTALRDFADREKVVDHLPTSFQQ
jgi:hypothetical protein